MSFLGNLFRHIPTNWDDDPCANTYCQCPRCGLWSDIERWGHCEGCGREFDGSEDTQVGRYPPGW